MSTTAACPGCGEPVSPGDRFCTMCGGDVSLAQESAATAQLGIRTRSGARRREMLEALRKATLGEYEVLGELGVGGMACVFLAHDIALDRKVAIKVLSSAMLEGEDVAERFKREARTAASLSHPHIIPIHAVKDTEDLLFFVMKCVEGRPLDSIIQEIGPLPIKMVQAILTQVGGALSYAHRQGVIHRDIKPANIMIDKEGWAVVTDFGIAKVADAQALTITGAAVGTPAYMSPEQCSGAEVSSASDQYSLGVVAYEMLAGKQPFHGETLMGLMWAHVHDPPPPMTEAREGCPAVLAEAVERMLAKAPDERFPTLDDAVATIGSTTLGADDPVRTRLIDLAATNVVTTLASQVRTPTSPVPAGKSAADAAPNSAQVAGGSIGPQGTAVSEIDGRTASKPAAKRGRLLAAAGIAVILAPAGAWLAMRGAGAPPEETTSAGPPPPIAAALSVPDAPASMQAGSQVQLAADVIDAGGAVLSGQPVTWESSDPSVATVSIDGLLQAVAPGSAQIIARSGSHSAAVTVQIQAPTTAQDLSTRRPAGGGTVVSVRVAPASRSLSVGETIRIEARGLNAAGTVVSGDPPQWASTNPSVATVALDGLVRAVGEGTAEIVATVGAAQGRAAVTVQPIAVAIVDISPPPGPLMSGIAVTLGATAMDANGNALQGRAVSWASSDEAIATVSRGGVVSPMSAGQATITATIGGRSGSVTVMVEAAPDGGAEPAPTEADPRPDVEAVIAAYAAAIEARDLAAIRGVYPGLRSNQERGFRGLFENARDLSVTLRVLGIVVNGAAARATVEQTMVFRISQVERQTSTFDVELERDAGGWRIVSVP